MYLDICGYIYTCKTKALKGSFSVYRTFWGLLISEFGLEEIKH